MLLSVLLPTSSPLSERKSRSGGEISAWLVCSPVCRSSRPITNPTTGFHMSVYGTLPSNEGVSWHDLVHNLQVLEIFENWESVDFARAGSKATQDFSLAMGPLESPEGPLSHTVEPFLRQHKLPVKYDQLPISPHPPPTLTFACTTIPHHSYTLSVLDS